MIDCIIRNLTAVFMYQDAVILRSLCLSLKLFFSLICYFFLFILEKKNT